MHVGVSVAGYIVYALPSPTMFLLTARKVMQSVSGAVSIQLMKRLLASLQWDIQASTT